MIQLLDETIQMIHINSNKEITPALIKHTLMLAKAGNNYAKFYTDKYYIIVSFNKDNTFSISHNIRNLDFYRELMRLQNNNRSKNNISLYYPFLCRWLERIRKGKIY
jgi:hypothetical protein